MIDMTPFDFAALRASDPVAAADSLAAWSESPVVGDFSNKKMMALSRRYPLANMAMETNHFR